MSEFPIHRNVDPRRSDHGDGGVHEDAVVPVLVGLGQRVAGHASVDAAVVTSWSKGRETRDSLSQAGTTGDLSEDHAQELVFARERSDATIACVAIDGVVEGATRQEIDELSKDGTTLVHATTVTPPVRSAYARKAQLNSNRVPPQTPPKPLRTQCQIDV